MAYYGEVSYDMHYCQTQTIYIVYARDTIVIYVWLFQ